MTVLNNKYQDSQAYTEDLIRSILNGILAIDREGNITVINEMGMKICGLEGAVVGERAESQVPQPVYDLLRQAMEEETGISKEVAFPGGGEGHHGPERQVMCNVSPLRNSRGEVVGAVAVMEDVTERRAMERKLARQDRVSSLGRFAAGILHEISTPLTSLKTALETACDKFNEGEEGEEAAREALSAGLRHLEDLEALARRLLHFSRPVQRQVGAVDLGQIVKDVVRVIQPQAR